MIAETRQELAALLAEATGFKAFTYTPRPLAPQSIVVSYPQGRFIDMPEGATMRAPYEIAFDALIVVKNLNAKSTTEQTDDLLEKAITAALDAGWSLEALDTYSMTAQNGDFYVTRLTLTKFINL